MSGWLGQFEQLGPLLQQHRRLRQAALDPGLSWLLPVETLPGVSAAYGLPVVRIDGLAEPMLGYPLSTAS